ncbi:hypothetical protein JX266_012966 [Neoarthrinium moseri]|uniref:uncharacterized protein n=1 Tax=Neoarthrinium moseri TaxID=1658444 RepID=UPI001FDBBD2F|nr:uncharacterized protein JN550_002584 [Neoarthrinium moseri]KAI1840818.1 hypothetical protein JX266_012966 [Neoarthrinium moseri]KAI1874005.1 hypothetical protein JN550_002584 [Neoarthrinium moseri]
MAPPSTPTPHRFLVPKRSASQRNSTPQTLQGGTQQFHATPRFSLHSTPREPAPSLTSSTPARPAAFLRQRASDSISDVLDSSPPVPQPSAHSNDSIEVDSIPASSAFPAGEYKSQPEASDDEADRPSHKRRRLSEISVVDSHTSLVSAEDQSFQVVDEQHVVNDSDELSGAESDAPESPKVASLQQPIFHRAPRFIPVEKPEESHQEPLPDVFSPRRRGAKYVPGGLAAELRGWLMDIEANTGPKREDEFVARVRVHEVRRGTGVTLITGRFISDENPLEQHRGQYPTMRIMLAGEGRLAGLARRNEVTVDSIIGIAKPVWEANLGYESRWAAVACDWVVL